MRRALHLLVPPTPEIDLTPDLSTGEKKFQVESILLTEETMGEVLDKIFSSESISLWQKL